MNKDTDIESPQPRTPSWSVPFMVLLFGIALALRLIYLYQFSGFPTFTHLTIDQEYYNLWGKRIVAEGLLGNEVYEMTPLYAYLLAFFHKYITSDLFTIRVLQSLLGSLTVLYTYRLGLRLGGIGVAVMAGLASAAYGLFIMYDGMVMKTFLSTFFCLISLYYLVAARDKGPLHYLLPGLLLGLWILVRENALLLLGVVPLCLFIEEAFVLKGEGNGGGSTGSTRVAAIRRGLERSGAFIIGALIVIAPVTVRNYVVSDGDFVPVTAGGGEVLYIAYYEGTTGYYVPPPFLKNPNPQMEHEEFRVEAERRTGRELTRKESSDYWTGEALNIIKDDPTRFFHLLYRKFIIFWNFYEMPDSQNFQFMKTTTPLLKYTLTFGVVGPLSILGLILALKRWRTFIMPYAFFLTYMVSVLIVFNFSRFRAPIVPVLIIFGAYYLDWLYRTVKGGALRRSALTLVPLLLLVLGVNNPIGSIEPDRLFFDTEYSKLGRGYYLEGRLEEAKGAYNSIIELNRSAEDGYLGLGRIALQEGENEVALENFVKAVKAGPNNFRGYYGLSVAYGRLGMKSESDRALAYALRLNPNLFGGR